MKKTAIFFLVGPTATGKSSIAIHLARKLNAEIISLDSMQVYKGMDILSAKPDAAARKKIRHHLISIVEPARSFNAQDYRRQALRAIKGIIKRKKTPLFVGGCGLYMSTLLDGIFTEKTKDKAIRGRLEREAQGKNKDAMHKRLKKVDPEAAARIHPNDLRRVIRALEVYEKCGVPISTLQKTRKGIAAKYQIRIFGLDMRRQALYAKIDSRVDDMLKKGLLRETSRLIKRRLSRTCAAAIGVKEVRAYLNGDLSLDDARSMIKRNSRLYSKRQMTWFRKDKRVEWLKISKNDSAQSIAQKILKKA